MPDLSTSDRPQRLGTRCFLLVGGLRALGALNRWLPIRMPLWTFLHHVGALTIPAADVLALALALAFSLSSFTLLCRRSGRFSGCRETLLSIPPESLAFAQPHVPWASDCVPLLQSPILGKPHPELSDGLEVAARRKLSVLLRCSSLLASPWLLAPTVLLCGASDRPVDPGGSQSGTRP